VNKVILSGTPIDDQPIDLWSQFKFLNPDVLGTQWKDFEEKFLEPVDEHLIKRTKKFKPGTMAWRMAIRNLAILKNKRGFDFDKLPEFLDLIEPYCLHITKDVIKLPPIRIIEKQCVMRGAQKKLYNKLKKDFVTKLPDITAPLKINQIAKLAQITGGLVLDDTGELYLVGQTKIRQLVHIIYKCNYPVVIFAKYRAEIDLIKETLERYGVVEVITGRTKKSLRPQIIQEFQQGDIDFLVCQQRTGGVGIDLFKSNIVIMYSLTFSYIDFEQAISRVYRRGQINPVTVYILVAANSIDRVIVDTIYRKKNINQVVISPLEVFRLSA
jgi:SNF2 family DNA or RNA helicase